MHALNHKTSTMDGMEIGACWKACNGAPDFALLMPELYLITAKKGQPCVHVWNFDKGELVAVPQVVDNDVVEVCSMTVFEKQLFIFAYQPNTRELHIRRWPTNRYKRIQMPYAVESTHLLTDLYPFFVLQTAVPSNMTTTRSQWLFNPLTFACWQSNTLLSLPTLSAIDYREIQEGRDKFWWESETLYTSMWIGNTRISPSKHFASNIQKLLVTPTHLLVIEIAGDVTCFRRP